MNCVGTQLTDPAGAWIATQPFGSSRSTTTRVPLGRLPVSGRRSPGPARIFTSGSVTVARYGTVWAGAAAGSRSVTRPAASAGSTGASDRYGNTGPSTSAY